MSNKPEFVDLISVATRQHWRRPPRKIAIVTDVVVKEEPRLSHWPPARFAQWRLENLTPWKIKSWKIKDWI